MGAEALYHQAFAGNCFEDRRDELCGSNGLGPIFDCSGLMIATICKVRGMSIDDWGGPRHVRDFWQAACMSERGLTTTTMPAIGSLLVTKRTYTINGEDQVVPGHIGIVAGFKRNGTIFLHANPRRGRVEEVMLRETSTALGAISLAGLT